MKRGRQRQENARYILIDRQKAIQRDESLAAFAFERMIDDVRKTGGLLVDKAGLDIRGSDATRGAGVGHQLFSLGPRNKGGEIAARRNQRGGLGGNFVSLRGDVLLYGGGEAFAVLAITGDSRKMAGGLERLEEFMALLHVGRLDNQKRAFKGQVDDVQDGGLRFGWARRQPDNSRAAEQRSRRQLDGKAVRDGGGVGVVKANYFRIRAGPLQDRIGESLSSG